MTIAIRAIRLWRRGWLFWMAGHPVRVMRTARRDRPSGQVVAIRKSSPVDMRSPSQRPVK